VVSVVTAELVVSVASVAVVVSAVVVSVVVVSEPLLPSLLQPTSAVKLHTASWGARRIDRRRQMGRGCIEGSGIGERESRSRLLNTGARPGRRLAILLVSD